MHNVSADLLREAFINPIRFAFLLDDEFPAYGQMAADGAPKGFDYERAKSLFGMCRSNGWLCDVDNTVAVAEKFERDKHLNQSDLLVLDFHLDPERPDDPTKAISILQGLASSSHFNLVIIYTGAEPREVIRDVSYSLGAGCELSEAERAELRDVIEDLGDGVWERLKDFCSTAVIDNFLQSKRPSGSANDLREILRAEGVEGRMQNGIINLICEEYLQSKIPAGVLASRAPGQKVEASINSPTASSWVMNGNLFAVVVNKLEQPDVLVARLHEALVAWNPSPLRVLMIHARASLEKVGTIADEKVLDTPRRQAGWLLRILLATSEESRAKYINDLYGRLFERLIRSADQEVIGFGLRLFIADGSPAVESARAMAMAPASLRDDFIYHALNEHLCSDSFTDGAMTTGVIFRAERSGHVSYWLCASPACDLVPGQNMGGWDGELHPFRPITAVRLTLIKDSGSIGERLRSATQGRHVFIFVDNEPVALEVADGSSRQMKMEILILANEGKIEGAVFNGFAIGKSDQADPSMHMLQFEALAVLRPEYASRLLAESGFQRSRIGVDFVNL